LFHDIHASTARALPRILEELHAHNFRVVHLVPKAGVETLAEYDDLARRAADRRRLATAGNPLAKRAIVPPPGILEAIGALPPAPALRSAPPGEDWTAKLWRQSQ
jgi:hypothetical protein